MVANINVGCCKGNNGAPKSVCWTPPPDYSHMCATPANYVGDHVIMGTFTCDSVVASNTPLAGIDFSSTYDCSSSTFQIKSTVNSIVSAGCCGTGDGIGQRSTCWVDNSYICATPANYVNAVIDNSGPGGACDQMINRDKDYICSGHGACTAENGEKGVFYGISFASLYDCSSASAEVSSKINSYAAKCCGGAPKSACSADAPDPAAKCSSLTCPSGKVLKASYCANCDGKNNGEPTTPTPCSTESECTASSGQCVLTNNGDRISGSDITDEASCTDGKTDRTWKPAVWMTSATTDCASDPCTANADAATCCAESSVAPPVAPPVTSAPSPTRNSTAGDGSESLATGLNVGISTMLFVFVAMVTTIQNW